MLSDVVISLEQVSKCYPIYAKPVHRLQQMFLPSLYAYFGTPEKKYYSEFRALKNINLNIRKGETVAVVGKNGSGKSTLLQVICGTLNASEGRVSTVGKIAALLELGSGFNPEFTGLENIYLNAAILGLSKTETDNRLSGILQFADIGDFITQPVKTYSSGMYVRLAFAIVAHVDADILIIDEALAVGDVFFTQKCMRFLHEFKKNGTLLFVTHDTSSVINLCERAIWLDSGTLKLSGSAKQVCEAYLAEFYPHPFNSVEIKPAEPADNQAIGYTPITDYFDLRHDNIINSSLRNDLEVFRFNELAADFGSGLVTIKDIYFTVGPDAATWFVGGEMVMLNIVAHTAINLDGPIIGFMVKNKNGVILFSDNTFLTHGQGSFNVVAGEYFSTSFEFRMPILPAGDYTLGVAVANGTQYDHIMHLWIHDAVAFKSHSSSVSTGLLGVPMKNIGMKKI